MSGSVTSLGSAQIQSEVATVQARLQQPITLLQDQTAADKAEISAWGAISGTIATLQTSLAGIKDLSTINNRSATSSVTTVATATATNTALPATYDLTGVTLAKTQEIFSGILGSGAASLGTGSGSLTLTLKGGKPEIVQVGSSDMTLNGIAQAINKIAGGVQASVVGTAGGARLVLQGSATGSSQAFSVQGTGLLAQFNYASGASASAPKQPFTLAQPASNAALNINGVPITSTSNTITTAVAGVTLNLTGSGTSTVTVGSSPGAIAAAVGSVASDLSAAVAAINKETQYVAPSSASAATTSSAKTGPLLGNFSASDLAAQLLTSISGAAASGESANSIGFAVSSTGAVTFNSATFATAYAANATGVTALISQIYKGINTLATSAVGSSGTGGTVAAAVKDDNTDITNLNAEIANIALSNDAQISILVQEYSIAEAASTSASITQSYLSIYTSSSTSKG
jgi:flagellar hook-associated protein 2